MRLLPLVKKRLRQALGPRVLKLSERVLARLGFPTNASGNNMSMR